MSGFADPITRSRPISCPAQRPGSSPLEFSDALSCNSPATGSSWPVTIQRNWLNQTAEKTAVFSHAQFLDFIAKFYYSFINSPLTNAADYIQRNIPKSPEEDRILLREIADLLGENKQELLFFAVKRQHPSLIPLICEECNIPANVQDLEGNTPLHFAVHEKCAEAARNLLHRGATPDCKNRHNLTPAKYAHMLEFYEVEELRPHPVSAKSYLAEESSFPTHFPELSDSL